jgi:murein L,D-transpeptidase YafK
MQATQKIGYSIKRTVVHHKEVSSVQFWQISTWDKLDKYMNEYVKKFDKGEKRKAERASEDFANARKRNVRKLKKVTDEQERKELIRTIRDDEKKRVLVPSGDQMDENYKRLKYVRYADDFLIGIIGSKS